MSGFGMGGGFGGGRSNADNPQLKAAKLQMEMVQDLYNRMSDMCFKKCMGHFTENDLNAGEMSCVDRCVKKYMSANQKVGETFQEFQQAEQARMGAQGMQPQA